MSCFLFLSSRSEYDFLPESLPPLRDRLLRSFLLLSRLFLGEGVRFDSTLRPNSIHSSSFETTQILPLSSPLFVIISPLDSLRPLSRYFLECDLDLERERDLFLFFFLLSEGEPPLSFDLLRDFDFEAALFDSFRV